MSRVVARPRALLDGSPEASRIVQPGSDAERYYNRGLAAQQIAGLLNDVLLLSEPDMPRLGFTKVGGVANHTAMLVQGEPANPPVRYGYWVDPQGKGEMIELSRLEGDDTTILANVDVKNLSNPKFLGPDLVSVIDGEARLEELKQLLAVGKDASEWALD